MTDPATLRAEQVTALRQIPGLVALLGGLTANIVDYQEELNGDLLNTIVGLEPPKLLVVYQGTKPTGGQRSLWEHDFSWIVRVSGSPTAVLAAIVNGSRTGGTGLPFVSDSINTNYHPMTTPTMRRAYIPVSDRSSMDYWEISTSFTSRGFE